MQRLDQTTQTVRFICPTCMYYAKSKHVTVQFAEGFYYTVLIVYSQKLRGMERLGWFSVILPGRGKSCNFLFDFLLASPLLKRSLR